MPAERKRTNGMTAAACAAADFSCAQNSTMTALVDTTALVSIFLLAVRLFHIGLLAIMRTIA